MGGAAGLLRAGEKRVGLLLVGCSKGKRKLLVHVWEERTPWMGEERSCCLLGPLDGEAEGKKVVAAGLGKSKESGKIEKEGEIFIVSS